MSRISITMTNLNTLKPAYENMLGFVCLKSVLLGNEYDTFIAGLEDADYNDYHKRRLRI